MSEHTPGPWRVIPKDEEFREHFGIGAPKSHHGQCRSDHEANVVSPCCGAGIFSDADARLISAAPDLLEAGLACLKKMDGCYCEDGGCAFCLMSKAVDKARGTDQ